MTRRSVDEDALKRSAARSTRESAFLERRAVPDGFVRSSRAERFLAERRRGD